MSILLPTTNNIKLKELLISCGEYNIDGRYSTFKKTKQKQNVNKMSPPVGSWIKDKFKRLSAKQKRDSCKYYNRHSGSCLEYKIMACHKCLKFKKK